MVLKYLLRLPFFIIAFLLILQFQIPGAWGQETTTTLVAGALTDFPPQYSTDAQTGEPTGFAIDIMNTVAERLVGNVTEPAH